MIQELLADADFVAKFASPQNTADAAATIDLPAAIKSAFATPILYPPIPESVFAGDTVAIVLQNELPQAKAVLNAIIDQLSGLNVAATDITVVITEKTAADFSIDPKTYRLPAETKDEQPPAIFPLEFGLHTISCQVHDGSNTAGLSYLAANRAGDPVYVNRLLVDADVVIPVAAASPGDVKRQTDCIYPDYGSDVTRQRFDEPDASFIDRQEEIELANEMLGSFFILQVVDGPGGTISEVLAGERRRTTDQARLATNERWEFQFDGAADVVLASIETDQDQQTWADVVEAIFTADRLLAGEGPIIVVSEINTKPNSKIRSALQAQFDDAGQAKKQSDQMIALAAIVAQRPVFLKSNLQQAVVEDLGLGHLATPEQVNRIAEPFAVGLLVRDAHKCQLTAIESESV
jgi:hypothetical protein